jgi:hypothetical protein
MTPRQVTKADILAALDQQPAGSVLDRCRVAVATDERESFTVGEERSSILRKSLEAKQRIARSKGKRLEGGDELLLALGELDHEPVTIVVVTEEVMHHMIYMRSRTLEPVGAVIMKDSGD